MKKKYTKLILVDIIIIIMSVLLSMMGNEGKKKLDISMSEWKSDYVEIKNNQWKISSNLENNSEEKVFLYGPYVSLSKGTYTLQVWYQCDENQSMLPYANGGNDSFIKATKAILDKNKNYEEVQFDLTQDINNFEVQFMYNGKGDYSISNISISKESNWKKDITLCIGVVLIIINVLIICHKDKKVSRAFRDIMAIAVISSLPLFFEGVNDTYGQDLAFHLLRIEGIYKELIRGNFPVHISSIWLGGYGYPTSVFYGDILLYFPALLRILGIGLGLAYKIYVFMINFGTALISWICFKKIFHRSDIASILALIYSTASYRLVDIYVRSAVGEYSVMMFIPLIILSIYNIYTEKNVKRLNITNATLLACGISGVITSHILTAEIVVFILGIFCIVCIKKTLTKGVLKTFIFAIVETLLLCCYFIVPFLDYYINVPVMVTDKAEAVKMIQDNGVNIGDYFSFFKNPFGYAKTMLLTPGIVLIGTLIVGIWLWKKGRANRKMKMAILFSVLTLYIASNIFPWDTLAYKYRIFNFLAQVQFPWRYLAITIAILTVLLGFELRAVEQRNKCYKYKKIICLLSVWSVCVFTGFYSDNALRNNYYDTSNLDSYGVMGAEYVRTGQKIEQFDGKIESKNLIKVNLEKRNGYNIDLFCENSEKVGEVIFPITNYKGYCVTDSLGNEYEIKDSENKLVNVEIPPHFKGKLYLRFKEPKIWTLSYIITGVTLVILLSYYSLRSKKYVDRTLWRKAENEKNIIDCTLL